MWYKGPTAYILNICASSTCIDRLGPRTTVNELSAEGESHKRNMEAKSENSRLTIDCFRDLNIHQTIELTTLKQIRVAEEKIAHSPPHYAAVGGRIKTSPTSVPLYCVKHWHMHVAVLSLALLKVFKMNMCPIVNHNVVAWSGDSRC